MARDIFSGLPTPPSFSLLGLITVPPSKLRQNSTRVDEISTPVAPAIGRICVFMRVKLPGSKYDPSRSMGEFQIILLYFACLNRPLRPISRVSPSTRLSWKRTATFAETQEP
jgi:hypothetical protein